MSLEVDMRGNTLIVDAIEGEVEVSNASNITIGSPAMTGPGESVTIAAGATLREALQTILDEIDPAG